MPDKPSEMKRIYGLIGYPLEHSFSESYFAEKFRKENITDAVYRNFPMEDIDGFEDLRIQHPDLLGLNVTIPHKESVIKYLDVLSEDAREIQAVNTICLCRKTGHLVKVGHNTDVIGFRKTLEATITAPPETALVLGTGGSSKAVVHVLRKMGTEIVSVSSTGKEGAIGYQQLDSALINKAQLIVNTTPLGMFPGIDRYPDIPYEHLSEHHLLYDLVYNPEETEFLKRGKQQGARTVNGYQMLIEQAEASWEIWNR
jgi:shikimate dehydrogenase